MCARIDMLQQKMENLSPGFLLSGKYSLIHSICNFFLRFAPTSIFVIFGTGTGVKEHF